MRIAPPTVPSVPVTIRTLSGAHDAPMVILARGAKLVISCVPAPAPQMFTLRSYEAVATRAPSGENATVLIGSSCWPSMMVGGASSSASHSMAVISSDPETSLRPSGYQSTLLTAAVCQSSVRRTCPEATSHVCTRPLVAPLTIRVPSGDHAMLVRLSPPVSMVRRAASWPTFARSITTGVGRGVLVGGGVSVGRGDGPAVGGSVGRDGSVVVDATAGVSVAD